MMWVVAVGSLATLWLLGALALSVMGARPKHSVHAIAADFTTGAAILGALGTVMIVLGLRLSMFPFMVLTVLLAALAVRARRLPTLRFSPPLDMVAQCVVVCTVFAVAAVAFAAMHDRLWWDGWAIWALKGRVLFLEGTLPRAFLTDFYAFAHLDYPLAVPLVDWWVWRAIGTVSPAVASFIGAVWFAILAMLLWTGVRRHAGERLAALAALGIALFWPVAFYATGGTADVVVALALLGAIVELDGLQNNSDTGALLRCMTVVTLGVLAKNEGLALAAVVTPVAGVSLFASGERRIHRFALLGLPFMVLAPWWLFVRTLDLRSAVLAPAMLSAIGDRVPLFLESIAAFAVSLPWLPLSLIALVGVVGAFTRREQRVTLGWLILGGYFCAVTVVYLLTPHDMAWLLETSLPRVLSVFGAPAVYLTIASLYRPITPDSEPALRPGV